MKSSPSSNRLAQNISKCNYKIQGQYNNPIFPCGYAAALQQTHIPFPIPLKISADWKGYSFTYHFP